MATRDRTDSPRIEKDRRAMSRRIVLIGGGVRSGKSAYALVRARELGAARAFVATAQAFDAEMQARIDAHKKERDASFVTFEEPLQVSAILETRSDFEVIVVDCLTLWLSNQLMTGADDAAITSAIDALVASVNRSASSVVLVTNEVGLGLVPESELGRRFRDHAGALHRRVAFHADEIYLGAMGVMLRLAPGPVERVPPWTP